MSDVFLSYSSENREQIQPLAHALEKEGWTVWWDRKISIGKRYDQEIRQAIEEAQCVVVVWTRASVDSGWVRDEASLANKLGKLFPVKLEDVNPPFGFGVIQTANLVDWDGKDSHPEFTRLVQAIHQKCPRSADLTQEEIPPPPPPPLPKVWPFLLFIGLPIIIGILLWFIPLNRLEVQLQANVSEFSFISTTQQELSDPLGIKSFKAAGLSQIQIPGTSETPDESLTINENMLGTIIVTPGSNGEDEGDMTLDTLTLPQGSSMRVVKTASPFQYNMTFDHLNQPLKVNVKGSVDIMVPGIGVKHRVFRFPKPLLLQPGPSGIDMEITVVDLADNLLPSPLSVTNLGFVRIDERRGDDRTTVRKVSTILAGDFSLNGESQQLASEEYLQFDHSEGSLRAIRLNQDNLKVEFHGQIQGMKSCQEKNQCTSLMPTYGEWLLINYSAVVVIGGIVYYILILLGRLQGWKCKLTNKEN